MYPTCATSRRHFDFTFFGRGEGKVTSSCMGWDQLAIYLTRCQHCRSPGKKKKKKHIKCQVSPVNTRTGSQCFSGSEYMTIH